MLLRACLQEVQDRERALASFAECVTGKCHLYQQSGPGEGWRLREQENPESTFVERVVDGSVDRDVHVSSGVRGVQRTGTAFHWGWSLPAEWSSRGWVRR